MRERRKPLNGISHSLTLQALTPALSRWERGFKGLCDTFSQKLLLELKKPSPLPLGEGQGEGSFNKLQTNLFTESLHPHLNPGKYVPDIFDRLHPCSRLLKGEEVFLIGFCDTLFKFVAVSGTPL